MFPIDAHSFRRAALTSLGLRSLRLALLCVVFVVSIVSFLNLRYTVNDNTGIIDFMTGGYPIPYVGIALSSLLHQAYVLAPGVHWFAFTLYALQTLSLFLWLMLVWRVFRNRWLAAAGTLVVLGYYLGFIVSLDFTATSIMLCTVALSWACVQAVERRPGSLCFLGPGVVFAIGMLVRPQGASGTLAYALPLAVLTAVSCIRGRALMPEARRLGLAACLFLLPAVLNQGVDTLWRDAVRTPQETQYDAFNAAGGRLMHLNPGRVYAISQDPALLAAVHWTPRDVSHFQHWQFLDERVYTPESFQTLWAGAPLPTFTPGYVDQRILQRFPPHSYVFLLLAAALPLFLYLLGWSRIEGVIGIGLPVYFVSLTVFMYLMYAYGERVEWPFETGIGFAGLLMAGLLAYRQDRIKGRGFLLAACASMGIALVGTGFAVQETLSDQQQVAVTAAQVRHRVYGLNKYFAGSVILVQPNSLDLNVLSPLEHVELHFQPINLGWNTFSPRFYRQISALGIEHGYQLVDALIDRPDTYVLGPQEWCQNLLSYASDSDRRGIRLVNVGTELFRLSEDKKK